MKSSTTANETNTDNITVQIDIMDNDTLQTKIATAVSTGTDRRLCWWALSIFISMRENGLIEDISDFWDTMALTKSNFYENVLAKSYIDEALYGVPMQYNVQYLYYNKDLSRRQVLIRRTRRPRSMNCARRRSPAPIRLRISMDWDFRPITVITCEYLWANGGDVINEDATQNLLNSEENIATLEWIQKLATEDGVSPEDHRSGCGHDGPSPASLQCIPAHSWNINGLTQLGLNYGITAIPGGSDGAYSPEGGCSYMLTKGADEQTKRGSV